MKDWYRVIMDPNPNPLSILPRAQRFEIMVVLSLMWTAIFSAMTGVWFLYEELVMLPMLLAAGALLTGATFRAVQKTETTATIRAAMAPRATKTDGDRPEGRRKATP